MSGIAVLGLCLVGSFICHGLEVTYGRAELRRYLRRKGLKVNRLRWRPSWPLRQVRFAVEADQNGKQLQGVALVGGRWTGPVLSRLIDLDWDRP